jgi:soluble lytic murein transglycosylase-like protein
MKKNNILWKDEHLYSKKAKRIFYVVCSVALFSFSWGVYQTFYTNKVLEKTQKLINDQKETLVQINQNQNKIDAFADYISNQIGNKEDQFALSKLRELYILRYNLSFSSDEMLRLLRFLYKTSLANGINPEIIFYMGITESGWNPNAISNKNAMGILQILPSTARICDNLKEESKLLDPFYNIYLGIKWYRVLLDKHKGNNEMALNEYWSGVSGIQSSAYSTKILNSIK